MMTKNGLMINAVFQYMMKATTNAAQNVAMAVSITASLLVTASWTVPISDMMRLVISPGPKRSKNAIFWRKMAAR